MSANSSLYHCSDSRAAVLIGLSFTVTKTLLVLPVCVLVLRLAHQRWRRQRSFAATSHSDVFAYHAVAIELVSMLGGAIFTSGWAMGVMGLTVVGVYLYGSAYPGMIYLHVLTCAERYLAVVHPVTYVALKQSGGVHVRNLSGVCVWLLCGGWAGVITAFMPNIPFNAFFCMVVVSLVAVTFCSLRVLCVLIRPGPGEAGGNRERVDQSKQRAFHTVAAITAVLWFWFASMLACFALDFSDLLSHNNGCLVLTLTSWSSLPSSAVLPVLFLHRAGKLC